MTRLTILTPTAGRLSIARTLESYAHQMASEDEYIVVGDTADGPLPETERIVASFGPRFRYVSRNNTEHTYGHEEINFGLTLATGEYICGNDDDDAATPDALDAIRQAIAELSEPRPLMFRFMSWMDVVFWDEPVLRECHAGGHCLVAPNIPERLGRYSRRYNGDFDWLRSTIDLWPGKDESIVWRENLIAWARPTEAEWAGLLQPKREAVA